MSATEGEEDDGDEETWGKSKAVVEGVRVPTRGFAKGTVGRNGPLVKSDAPIHPSGWRALGKGSRGPNRRTLGRAAGSRAESAAAQQQARRSGRVTANGVGMGQGGGSPEL